MLYTKDLDSGSCDLAVIIVSHGSADWLGPCLTSIYTRAGGLDLDVVVVENGEPGPTSELLQREFPDTRMLECENRGFAHANNLALCTVDAPFVLLLNPDTEILEGTLGDLVFALRERPGVGVVGVKQVTPEGELWPTIRRFPNAVRTLFEALGSESFPVRARWLGERELDLSRYERETGCDWTSGSFMLIRREALESAGLLDERFFLYCEEPDLCKRIKDAGWDVRHLPSMTIQHDAGRGRWNPRLAAQEAYARRQYMTKHHSAPHRSAGIAALSLGLVLRSTLGGRDRTRNSRRRATSRDALRTLLGFEPPPFGSPPGQAVSVESTGDGLSRVNGTRRREIARNDADPADRLGQS
jgi:N-acetylglucosaminyl-diphospho-decaprenol L-rhamnosyltransferase